MPLPLKHIFVLMLETRSFDHMFGFSCLTGIDAATGGHTIVNGLTGRETNDFNGHTFQVAAGADYGMPVDPSHEFLTVLDQLCGPAARYPSGGSYPLVNTSGFVDSYFHSGGGASLAEVMKCFDTPRQVPVVHALAKELALCDRWHRSVPGPSWPNRMFAHAASSGGLDHSELFDVHGLDDLKEDLQTNPFPFSYVFVEPSYNVLHDFKNSSCQHPLADVRDGEALIKSVYESIRNSAVWPNSMLIVTWDEHGGFFDHVPPSLARPPGDTAPGSKLQPIRIHFRTIPGAGSGAGDLPVCSAQHHRSSGLRSRLYSRDCKQTLRRRASHSARRRGQQPSSARLPRCAENRRTRPTTRRAKRVLVRKDQCPTSCGADRRRCGSGSSPGRFGKSGSDSRQGGKDRGAR